GRRGPAWREPCSLSCRKKPHGRRWHPEVACRPMNPLCAMFVAVALAAPQPPDQAPPPLDLAPLIPPSKSPWPQKNQKPPQKTKPPPGAPRPLRPPVHLQQAPPLVKVAVDVGVFRQNDGLGAPAAARVAEGLRGVAKNAPLLTRPAQPCSDDACWAALGASQKVDQ